MFVAEAQRQLEASNEYSERTRWVNWTYQTEDTEWLASRADAQAGELAVRLAKAATQFDASENLPADLRRKLYMLRREIVLPAPDRPGAADELGRLAARLVTRFAQARGSYLGQSKTGEEIEALIATVRDPHALSEIWRSWHDAARPMRDDYARMVTIANEGARELGYGDVGELWRSKYDMSGQEFVALTERLWGEVKPLYEQLHCYTRARLNERYGDAVQPKHGPIRADLLGNIGGHKWNNIYEVLAPAGMEMSGYDLGELLKAHDYDALKMVRAGERFFVSLGFDRLPGSFWERSMFVRPADRNVICHASEWGVGDDLRIKMCIKGTADDFLTVHHELGHNYYAHSYRQQPFLFRSGANEAFHEAIGDMIGLSVTPEYMARIGLLPAANIPDSSKDIGLLLALALNKVAAQPFGLIVDKWRWGVFAGEIQPEQYTRTWNALRLQYQGIAAPVGRSDQDFDPGARFHIPSNTSYIRYFLSRFLQFQLHEAACRRAGWRGPLHRCSLYADKSVGENLRAMLMLGASQPWPDTLEVFTGSRQISAEALLRYFEPLTVWLKQQNHGRQCGW
jgi:peptidyl-dipeptidase A